jgi:hypothetical protein
LKKLAFLFLLFCPFQWSKMSMFRLASFISYCRQIHALMAIVKGTKLGRGDCCVLDKYPFTGSTFLN